MNFQFIKGLQSYKILNLNNRIRSWPTIEKVAQSAPGPFKKCNTKYSQQGALMIYQSRWNIFKPKFFCFTSHSNFGLKFGSVISLSNNVA